jgi:hypothetical protein
MMTGLIFAHLVVEIHIKINMQKEVIYILISYSIFALTVIKKQPLIDYVKILMNN